MEKEKEIWKWIEGYVGLYKVSSWGSLKSFHYGKERVLSPGTNSGGYCVCILQNGGVRKSFRVNRLVASHFISNPEGKPTVNHIDEIKVNNYMGNLEWATHEEQVNHGTRNKRAGIAICITKTKKYGKKVNQFSLLGEFIKEWPSVRGVAKGGYTPENVSRCCRGNAKTASGFKWEFK